jgi:hypothetical protein
VWSLQTVASLLFMKRTSAESVLQGTDLWTHGHKAPASRHAAIHPNTETATTDAPTADRAGATIVSTPVGAPQKKAGASHAGIEAARRTLSVYAPLPYFATRNRTRLRRERLSLLGSGSKRHTVGAHDDPHRPPEDSCRQKNEQQLFAPMNLGHAPSSSHVVNARPRRSSLWGMRWAGVRRTRAKVNIGTRPRRLLGGRAGIERGSPSALITRGGGSGWRAPPRPSLHALKGKRRCSGRPTD